MAVIFLPREKAQGVAVWSFVVMVLFSWYLIWQIEICETGGKDQVTILVWLLQQRLNFVFFRECFNSLAFANIKFSYPIITLSFVVSSTFHPIYPMQSYYLFLFATVAVILTIAYVVKGCMAATFVYQQCNQQSQQILLDLIDNIPDAVLLLEPKETATTITFDPIIGGDVIPTFYDIHYCNQKTEAIFGP